jgi:hypothetical protein
MLASVIFNGARAAAVGKAHIARDNPTRRMGSCSSPYMLTDAGARATNRKSQATDATPFPLSTSRSRTMAQGQKLRQPARRYLKLERAHNR